MSKGMYYRRFASGSTTGRTNVTNLMKHFENGDNQNGTQNISKTSENRLNLDNMKSGNRFTEVNRNEEKNLTLVNDDSVENSSGQREVTKLPARNASMKKRAAPPPPASPTSNPPSLVYNKKRAAPPPPGSVKEVIIITKPRESESNQCENHHQNIVNNNLGLRVIQGTNYPQQSLQTSNERQDELSLFDRNKRQTESLTYSLSPRPNSPYEEASTDFSAPTSPSVEDSPKSSPGLMANVVQSTSPSSTISARRVSPALLELEGLSITARKLQFEKSRQLLEKTLHSNASPSGIKRSPSGKVSDIKKQLEQSLVFRVEQPNIREVKGQLDSADLARGKADGSEAQTPVSEEPQESPNDDASKEKFKLNPPEFNCEDSGSNIDSDLESVNSIEGAYSYEINEESETVAGKNDETNHDDAFQGRNEDNTITSGYRCGRENDKLGKSPSFVEFIASLDISNPVQI